MGPARCCFQTKTFYLHPSTRHGVPGKISFWIDNEIKTFLYNGGETPFKWDTLPNYVDYGTGIYKDDFDEAFERPNVLLHELIQLGISEDRLPFLKQ